MIRGVLALVAAIAAAVVLSAGSGAASPSATSTISCKQVWTGFNVQLIGNSDWGWTLGGLGSIGVPKNRVVILVWSMGGTLRGGLNVHSWATGRRARPSPRCTPVRAKLKPPSLAGLGQVWRTKDGWRYGRKFACLDRGRLLVTTTQTPSKTRVVVRMQASGKTVAIAEIAGRQGWIRGSKTCDDREK